MSIKEIAKRANTSISTVSRVLNDPNYHCNKKELGYYVYALIDPRYHEVFYIGKGHNNTSYNIFLL